MTTEDIKNLIKELLEKAAIHLNQISSTEEGGSMWISLDLPEPHQFVSHDGEGLYALNHLAHRILESRNRPKANPENRNEEREPAFIIDINGFQKKRVEGIKAIAHMMSERARYFKSNIEVDPMPAFDRRIIHEYLSGAADLKTESVGTGRSRRVVIKYTGNI